MGFTIANYSLFGLQPQNFYVSILGSYTIKKNHPVIGHYSITFTVYYSASKNTPVITQKEMFYNIQELPEPADIYSVIYDHIKSVLGDLQYIDD